MCYCACICVCAHVCVCVCMREQEGEGNRANGMEKARRWKGSRERKRVWERDLKHREGGREGGRQRTRGREGYRGEDVRVCAFVSGRGKARERERGMWKKLRERENARSLCNHLANGQCISQNKLQNYDKHTIMNPAPSAIDYGMNVYTWIPEFWRGRQGETCNRHMGGVNTRTGKIIHR